MKTQKVLALAIIIMLFSNTLPAQVTVSLGTYTGAGSTNVLLSTSTSTNKYSRTFSIYTAAEIIAAGGFAGTITSLAWDKGGTGEYLFGDAYIKIFVKHTSQTAWSTSPVPDWNTEIVGATEVFTSSTFSIPAGTGWKNIAFSTPFIWNGTDNVAIGVEWYRPSTPTGDMTWGRSTTTNANASRVGSTSLAALVFLVNSNRPLVQLTLTPSGPITVTGVTVSTQGSVPATITTNAGTLQMVASVQPLAANQNVIWSMINGTGTGTISPAGLVTAQSNGTVWAKAVSTADTTKMDSLQISISGQIVPVTGVVVSTLLGAPPVINIQAGTLPLVATVIPAGTNQTVTWSIINGTGSATISAMGEVTAVSNGTVWGKATSVQNSNFSDSILITITNQIIPVTSVSVQTQGGAPAVISTKAGTLQMEAVVLPAGASSMVAWSIVPGTGTATISTIGLVTASTNGTVWAKAVSTQDGTKKDSLMVTITNQDVGITDPASDEMFRIYPNPLSGNRLFIERVDGQNNASLELYIMDARGKMVLRTKLHPEDYYITLPDLSPGFYMMKMEDAKNQYVFKFSIL